jgi:acyl dehydratase
MEQQEKSLITDEVRAVIGKESEPSTSPDRVTLTEIRRFSQSVMDESPIYHDEEFAAKTKFGGVVAPGPFAYHFIRRRPPGTEDPMITEPDEWDGEENRGVGEGALTVPWPPNMRGFHGGNELEVLQLPKPGDIITSRSRIVDVYEKTGRSGRLGLSVRETVFTNQKGEILCIDRYTGVVREMK